MGNMFIWLQVNMHLTAPNGFITHSKPHVIQNQEKLLNMKIQLRHMMISEYVS